MIVKHMPAARKGSLCNAFYESKGTKAQHGAANANVVQPRMSKVEALARVNIEMQKSKRQTKKRKSTLAITMKSLRALRYFPTLTRPPPHTHPPVILLPSWPAFTATIWFVDRSRALCTCAMEAEAKGSGSNSEKITCRWAGAFRWPSRGGWRIVEVGR